MSGRCKTKFTCSAYMNEIMAGYEVGFHCCTWRVIYLNKKLLENFQSAAAVSYSTPNVSDLPYSMLITVWVSEPAGCFSSCWEMRTFSSPAVSLTPLNNCLKSCRFMSEVQILVDFHMLDWGYFAQACKCFVAVVHLFMWSFSPFMFECELPLERDKWII